MRVCGSYSTNTAARASTPACSSVLPGQSPPTALRCMPGSIIAGMRMVALVLSAVTVVTMSAPRTASAVLARRLQAGPGRRGWRRAWRWPRRRCRTGAARAMPSSARKASDWNSLCAPLPISAISGCRACEGRAASADVAAVRIAVAASFRESSTEAGRDVGQHAEGHHRRQTGARVLRMAVDVLEGERRGVGDRHQLDHAVARVAGDAGALFEFVPAPGVALDARRRRRRCRPARPCSTSRTTSCTPRYMVAGWRLRSWLYACVALQASVARRLGRQKRLECAATRAPLTETPVASGETLVPRSAPTGPPRSRSLQVTARSASEAGPLARAPLNAMAGLSLRDAPAHAPRQHGAPPQSECAGAGASRSSLMEFGISAWPTCRAVRPRPFRPGP